MNVAHPNKNQPSKQKIDFPTLQTISLFFADYFPTFE